MGSILVADDEEGLRSFLCEALEMSGHNTAEAKNGIEAINVVKQQSYDVLLTDLKMPGADGLQVLRTVRELQPDIQVILMTAHGSIETALQAMKEGAFDYLQKPLSGPAELRLLVERAIERRKLQRGQELIKLEQKDLNNALTWGAASMKMVVKAIERVALTPTSVLLLGESGTGKEVAARTIHELSPRKEGPFVAINCAAISESLLESEFFGHEKGSFTGASERRRGRLEVAEGGTFFLDEVGELKPSLQAKLLRVLEEKAFQRIGGAQLIKMDVRFIAATNRDLKKMIEQGTFREDLYHRLSVFPIDLPPLRERKEDILPLANVLLRRICVDSGRPPLRLSESACAAIQSAPWVGNIRQLRNVLERASIMLDGDEITVRDLGFESGKRSDAPNEVIALEELEIAAIKKALELTQGNRKEAAEKLGIGLRTLYDKLKLYDIK